MLAWESYSKLRKRRNKYKDTSKEERAKELKNIICPRCKYQNHEVYVKKYGKCHLCGVVIDKNYFIRTMLKEVKK